MNTELAKYTVKPISKSLRYNYKLFKDNEEILEIKSFWNRYEFDYKKVVHKIKQKNISGITYQISKVPYNIGSIHFNWKIQGRISLKLNSKEHNYKIGSKSNLWGTKKAFFLKNDKNEVVMNIKTIYSGLFIYKVNYIIELNKDIKAVDHIELITYFFLSSRILTTLRGY